MSPNGCTMSKTAWLNDYIGGVANRDRVMSVVQFVSMALHEPAAAAGCHKLSADLKTILNLTAQYRTITRFSQWLVVGPQLTPSGIQAVIRSSPSLDIGILKTIATAFFTVFLLGEEINLFAKYNILSPALGKKFNRIRFVFLFWSNIARLAMNYLLLKRSTYDAEKDAKIAKKAVEHKRKVLAVADGVLMTMFAYTLLKGSVPAGPAFLRRALKTADVVDIVAAFAPPVKVISSTPQGILGVAASIPGFMMSIL